MIQDILYFKVYLMPVLLSYCPFLPARVCLGHPLFVLASSNQRLPIFCRLIIYESWLLIGERLREQFVELRSRVYDAICPFCHRADLFRLRSLSPSGDCCNSFPIEVAWMEEPVRLLGFRQTLMRIYFIASEKIASAGIEPRSPWTKHYEACVLPLS